MSESIDHPCCYDCGIRYENFPVELVIAHDQWALISPKGNGEGLLCHNCMIDRLRNKGVEIVQVLFFGIDKQS